MPNLNKQQFTFGDYDAIGFDLDGTLTRYNLDLMVEMIYKALMKYLVNTKGYPENLLHDKIDWDFVQTGLFMDIFRGNVVKLNYEASIMKATHGTKELSRDEICKIYGPGCKWDLALKYFKDPLSTWESPWAEQIRACNDYFDACASLIFAKLVDADDCRTSTVLKDAKDKHHYKQIWLDVLDGLYNFYARGRDIDRSLFLQEMIEKRDIYVMKTNEQVIEKLKKMRNEGKVLFLLTGSEIEYAHHIARFALCENWQELFDIVLTYARKPGFFTKQEIFFAVEDNHEMPDKKISLDVDLEMNKTYGGGNWKQLLKCLAKKVDKDPQDLKCVYIGDNIIQDLYAPGHYNKIDSIAVIDHILESDRSTSSSKTIASDFWGSFLEVYGEQTFWSAMIEKYSKLSVPCVDGIIEIPICRSSII